MNLLGIENIYKDLTVTLPMKTLFWMLDIQFRISNLSKYYTKSECEFICLKHFHALGSQLILMKFSTLTYTLWYMVGTLHTGREPNQEQKLVF